MRARIFIVLGITGALGASAACRSATDTGAITLDQANVARQPSGDVPQAALQAAVDANNAFAAALYAQIRGDAGATNLLTSPISASLALTMTYAGAAGTTATQMASALQIEGDAGTSIFEGQNALSQELASVGSLALRNEQELQVPDASADDFQLEVVNSVWGQESYPWAEPFLSILAMDYGTGVVLEDFSTQSAQATQTINAWVSTETDGEINDLLPPMAIDSMTRMVLVNAVHLKFPWVNPFDPSATTTGAFVRSDGVTVSPSFMTQSEALLYEDDGQAQIASIPLTGGVAIVVALPHTGVDLAAYEAVLTPGVPPLATPSTTVQVALSLPKLTFTSPSFSLAASLQAMGMVDAFDPNAANFSGMCPQPPDGLNLYLSDVLQKTTVSMTETGVQAAAASAATLEVTSYEEPPTQSATLVLNRPYLLAILDPIGTVLFLGHIEDPTASSSP